MTDCRQSLLPRTPPRRKCTWRRLEPQWQCGSYGACFDLRNRTVLLCNDCLLVIFAIRKGSPSQVLQKAADDVCKEALEAGCRVLALHVPGVQLIDDERIDGGSREGALRLAGSAGTQRTRSKIQALLTQHSWIVTIDLFAG